MKKRNSLITVTAIVAALMMIMTALSACVSTRNDPPATTPADDPPAVSTGAPQTEAADTSSSAPQTDITTSPATEPATAEITSPATEPVTAPVTGETSVPATEPVTDPVTTPPVTTPPEPMTTGPETTAEPGPGTEQETTPVTDPPVTEPAVCEHRFGEWTIITAATCVDGVKTRKCTLCGKEEKMNYSTVTPLDGKRVMFAGNSMLYYGEVVINSNGSPTQKKGIFEKIAESFGDSVKVTNFTYGSAGFFDGRSKAGTDGLPSNMSNYGLYQLMTTLHPNYYGNPAGNAMDSFYDQDFVIFQQRGAHVADSYAQLGKLAALFPPKTKFAVMITHYDIAEKANNLAALKKTQKDGWMILPWGELVSDLWNGRVGGMGYKYTRADFVNTKDNQHPNFLTGYIEALMTYCALTGNTADGAGYSFVSRSLTYYPGGASTTKFATVLGDAEEMSRIQNLIDKRLYEYGAQAAARHTFGDWETTSPATCSTPGTRVRTCLTCGKSETVTVTVDHKFGDWKITTAADGGKPGVKSRTCEVCGKTETKNYTDSLLSGKAVSSGNWFGIKSMKNSASATDGGKTYDPASSAKYMDVGTKFSKSEMNSYDTIAKKYLPDGTLSADGKYLCGFWYKLDSKTKINSFALYNTATLMDIEGFDILVSTDGKTWQVVYSATDLVTGLKYVPVDSNTNMISGSFDATDASYVMFALTAPRSRNANATAGFNNKYGKNVSGPNDNPHYFRIVEFEIFAAD